MRAKKLIPLSKPIIGQEEIEVVEKVLRSGQLAQGPYVSKLERRFQKLCGVRYAVATINGTSALHTALYAIGIKTSDEVITTPFTFVASANAILMVNAHPVFIDIDEKTFNINPKRIEEAVSKKTKAILAINIFGQLADYAIIGEIAKKHKLLLVEDAAQSINATYKGKKSGNLADISCFSLYATKNIMCGEGGMITTNNPKYFKQAKQFRNHGQDEKTKYVYNALGYNFRMTEIQAAIALAQLKRLCWITRRRWLIAQKYNQAFHQIKGLVTPYVKRGASHVFHQYTLRVTREFKMNRNQLHSFLLKKGIQTEIYYPRPLYLFKHLYYQQAKVSDFPIVNRVIGEVLSLPVHPLLTDEEINYIIDTIKNI